MRRKEILNTFLQKKSMTIFLTINPDKQNVSKFQTLSKIQIIELCQYTTKSGKVKTSPTKADDLKWNVRKYRDSIVG